MATAYSGEVSIGTYNRIRIKCDYSGTSATCTVQFRRTQAYSSWWGDSTAKLTFNGQTKNAGYAYSGTVGTSWVNLVTVSGYSISTSGGTYNWNFSNPGGGVLGCSGNIYIPSQGTAPSNLNISIVNATWNSVTMETVVGNWGSGSDKQREAYLLEVPYVAGVEKYYESSLDGTTNPVESTVNAETSPFQFSNVPFTVYGCKEYHTGLWASTNVDVTRLQGPTFYTAPYKLDGLTYAGGQLEQGGTVSANLAVVTNLVHNNPSSHIGFEYRVSSDGGSTFGTWVISPTTVAVGGNTTLEVAGLTQGTAYVVEVRQFCTEATSGHFYSETSTVSFTADVFSRFYGSVSGLTKRVTKLYGPIGVVNITNWSLGSQTIVPGFDPTTMTALDDMAGELTADIVSIAVTYTASGHKLKADVNLSDGKVIHYITDGPIELLTVVRLARLGCDASIVSGWRANDSYPSTNLSDTVTITSTYTSKSKKIKKLYGSVNGQTKLVFGEGSTPAPTPEYTMKHYIKSIAAGYIDTGYKFTPNTSFEIEFCLDGTTFADGAVMGARHGGTVVLWSNCKSSSGVEDIALDTTSQYKITYSGSSRFKWHTVSLAVDGKVTVDGRVLNTVSRDSSTSTNNMILLGMQTNGTVDSRLYRGSVARCSFYESGTLVRNFLPAVRNSDNVIGFLETVNDTFYTNQGTGTWTTD